MSVQKIIFLLFVTNVAAQTLFAQTKISYGNNVAAGKYYTIRGMKMYCEVYGSGSPLLMIHGNGGTMGAFSGIIPWFAEKYQVIATDSRAQGKSTDVKDSLSFEMMADDESALLDSMHIKSAYVIGWSDGGIVALLLAMRHPDKVIKLASTGANLWPDSTAIIPSEWKEEKVQYEASKEKTFVTAKEKNDWKVFMLDWLQPNVAAKELQNIKCPSLIIAGDHDVITLEHTIIIYQHIPQAYLWILPDSGHATLEEHKDEFEKKVNEFFERPFHNRQ
ncbi:MAG: alpha/beta hydrolase [Bacteroidota bacterium]